MCRLPPDRRLSSLVSGGADVDAELRSVAHLLASFHARSERSETISQAGSPEAVLSRWEENFVQMQPFVGEVLDPAVAARIEELVRRYLAGRGPLLRRRMADAKVCDGHGDLQAEDIFCLPDGPRILDCVEFDDALRAGDVLCDVAFLAMDLQRLGAPRAVRRFLAWYQEFAAETWPGSLAHHYIAYRAHVRTKVACLRHAQGDPAARVQAAELLELARDHLEHGRVTMVLVGGLPGTGKSTLAEGLADDLGYAVLRSDEIRKDLAGVAHSEPSDAAYGQGLYRAEATTATYAEMLRRAATLLELGESVILDASWTRVPFRQQAGDLARATASRLIQLCCTLDPISAAQRIARRREVGGDPSDADAAIATQMAPHFDVWPEAVPIDTAAHIGAVIGAARAQLEHDRDGSAAARPGEVFEE
jgi:hypothetical protein